MTVNEQAIVDRMVGDIGGWTSSTGCTFENMPDYWFIDNAGDVLLRVTKRHLWQVASEEAKTGSTAATQAAVGEIIKLIRQQNGNG